MTVAPLSDEAVFAPVRSQTAFEETVDRLGTAIKLGLLPAAGGSQRLARLLPSTIAKQLLLTGDVITAQDAFRPTGRSRRIEHRAAERFIGDGR